MRPRRFAAYHDSAELFDLAVSEHALAVVTMQEGAEWRTFKSRFLERDPQERFFVLDYAPLNGEDLPKLMPGQYAGVSFRHKSRKIMFATVIEATGRFSVDDANSVAAVRYRWPESFTELQRRVYYRTPVPDGVNLLAHVWAGGVKARAAGQGSRACRVLAGRLADVSCGGALIRLAQNTAPNWEENSTVGAELHLADGRPPILLDARFRGCRNEDSEGLTAAIQFIGLEVSLDGRVNLNRLARCVQRFHRLNFPAGAREAENEDGR